MVKKIIVGILFVLSVILYYNLTVPASSTISVYIERAVDGDTLKSNDSQTFRLVGINTPERGQPYYGEAKDFLGDFVQDKIVEVELMGMDKYSRELAYVFYDGKNVNEEILRDGLGSLYYYDHDRHYEELRDAEKLARDEGLGIWKKSPSSKCVKIVEFKTDEPERLVLGNDCGFDIEMTYKDDATHIYHGVIPAGGIYENNFSHIWNTDGDSLYVYDEEGLLMFYRYF